MDNPVAWMLKTGHGTYFQETLSEEQKALEFGGKKMWVPLYRQPTAQWSGLSDEEAAACWTYNDRTSWKNIEQALKEKNT